MHQLTLTLELQDLITRRVAQGESMVQNRLLMNSDMGQRIDGFQCTFRQPREQPSATNILGAPPISYQPECIPALGECGALYRSKQNLRRHASRQHRHQGSQLQKCYRQVKRRVVGSQTSTFDSPEWAIALDLVQAPCSDYALERKQGDHLVASLQTPVDNTPSSLMPNDLVQASPPTASASVDTPAALTLRNTTTLLSTLASQNQGTPPNSPSSDPRATLASQNQGTPPNSPSSDPRTGCSGGEAHTGQCIAHASCYCCTHSSGTE